MTRDITRELAPEEFTITVRGIGGRRVAVASYDPISGRDVSLEVKSATADELIVRLEAADYPYLLTIREAAGGAEGSKARR